MSQNVFVFANEALSGKSLVSFSLIRLLRNHYSNVGFFRPITIHGVHKQDDPHIRAAKDFFHFDLPSEQLGGLNHHQVEEFIRQNQMTEVHEKIYANYEELCKKFDIVVCDSASLSPTLNNIELNLNLELANSLNCQVLCVINGHDKTLMEIGDQIILMSRILKENNCDVMGMIINRVIPIQIPALKNHIKELTIDLPILSIIPEDSKLNKPSIQDIQQLLQAEVLWGEDQLTRIAQQHTIAAKHPSTFLTVNYSKDESLIITPGDRQDILLSCILADQSKLYPNVGGIVLTTGIKPDPTISRIINGLEHTPPILLTMLNTFEVAAKLHAANYPTALFNKEKLDLGTLHVLQELDEEPFLEKVKKPREIKLTKYMLKHFLLNHAREHVMHIVLPEGEDIRVLKAAQTLISLEAAKITLIGNIKQIKKTANKYNIPIDYMNLVEPHLSADYEHYAQHLFEKRKHKNMTLSIAKDMLLDPVMFATCMVSSGDADGMVSGAIHTTSDTIRPALQIIKSQPSIPFIASIFVMCMHNKVIIYGDCAININPDAKQLAHIAMAAAKTAEQLNIDPKVAMLSYSSGSSGTGKSVDKVRDATELVKKHWPELKIAGPIQYDAAVDPKVGHQKLPNCDVAGQATVLIFPDLDTGNNTYKAVQREAHGLAIGPILLGLNKPVNDLSRGCEPEEIVMTCLITSLQAFAMQSNHS